MTSSIHKINKVNQLQYIFLIFCENFDGLCWDMSKILDYFDYLLTDTRGCNIVEKRWRLFIWPTYTFKIQWVTRKQATSC